MIIKNVIDNWYKYGVYFTNDIHKRNYNMYSDYVNGKYRTIKQLSEGYGKSIERTRQIIFRTHQFITDYDSDIRTRI